MQSAVRCNPWVAWIAAGCCWLAAPASFAVAELEPAEEMAAAAVPATTDGAFVAPDAGVARSAFTREVVEREPVDSLAVLRNDEVEVSYFTELRGLEGTRVFHRWTYQGEVAAEVPFEVGGARWRVHSRKRLDPEQVGDWTVFVVDENGRTLSEQTLHYLTPPEGEPGP